MADKNLVPLETIESIEHGVYVNPIESLTPMFNLDLDWEPGMRTDPNYTPYRLVIDLEMIPPDPDLEINFRVYYTDEDLENIKEIKLLKWNGTNWVLIPTNSIPLPNNQIWAGYFDVTGYKIGDPPLALGE